MTLKEFKAKFESDTAFRAKFADVKTEEEFVKVAKAEGINFEQLSEEDLDAVAGGRAVVDDIKLFWNWITS